MIVRPTTTDQNPLWAFFSTHEGRLILKLKHYFDIYHNHFSRFRGRPVKILEIGVYYGGSLQMWKHYFGSDAQIFGMDINPKCRELEEEQIKILIGDQSNRDFLKKISRTLAPFDIIIDDGGHRMNQQIVTFEELYSAVSESGIYLVEDVCTSYWEKYGGGYKNEHSFVEYSKKLIDKLNAWHSKTSELFVDDFTRSTTGIHFYDSVLVLEKYDNNIPPSVVKSGTIPGQNS